MLYSIKGFLEQQKSLFFIQNLDKGDEIMDNLYNIFSREKQRVGDKFTLFYDQKKQFLRYSNDDGALTVFFDAKQGSEKFYYTRDVKDFTSFGELIQQSVDHGNKATMLKEAISSCPQAFIDLCNDYQFNRQAIGVENMEKRERQRRSYERD